MVREHFFFSNVVPTSERQRRFHAGTMPGAATWHGLVSPDSEKTVGKLAVLAQKEDW